MKTDFIFWDIGGTIFNPDGNKEGACTPAHVRKLRFVRTQKILESLGYEVDIESLEIQGPEVERYILNSNPPYLVSIETIITALMRKLNIGVKTEEIPLISSAYAGPRYKSWLFEGMHETLSELINRGYKLGLIANTNANCYIMDSAFSGVGLLSFFSVRLYSCEVKIAKPSSEIFLKGMEIAGNSYKSFAYIGDSIEDDMSPAHQLGWLTCLRTSRPVFSRDVDYTFMHTKELLDIFK